MLLCKVALIYPPTIPFHNLSSPDYEYERARYYIKDRFANIVTKPHRDGAGEIIKDWHKEHNCFQHFTVATDTENIKKVFESCKTIIIQEHLRELNLQ